MVIRVFMKNTTNIFVTAILYIKHECLLGGTALGYCGDGLVGKLTPTKEGYQYICVVHEVMWGFPTENQKRRGGRHLGMLDYYYYLYYYI